MLQLVECMVDCYYDDADDGGGVREEENGKDKLINPSKSHVMEVSSSSG